MAKKQARKKTAKQKRAVSAAERAKKAKASARRRATKPEVVKGTKSQRQDAMERADQCDRGIKELLNSHHCRLVPILTRPIMVGESGATMQVSATYAIVPDPLPQ